jgi:hypothetical protein
MHFAKLLQHLAKAVEFFQSLSTLISGKVCPNRQFKKFCPLYDEDSVA